MVNQVSRGRHEPDFQVRYIRRVPRGPCCSLLRFLMADGCRERMSFMLVCGWRVCLVLLQLMVLCSSRLALGSKLAQDEGRGEHRCPHDMSIGRA